MPSRYGRGSGIGWLRRCFGLDRWWAPLMVGDGAGDFQDAVVSAGAKSLLSHGAFELRSQSAGILNKYECGGMNIWALQ